MSRKSKQKSLKIANRENRHTSSAVGEEHPPLRRRREDDPMRLHDKVISTLKNYFSKSDTTPLSTQMTALINIIDKILSAVPGTVTAVPLVPGGGKSSLIRALLMVLSELFTDMTSPLAQKLGGVIIVVEKSAEAHELARYCDAATIIESPNDFNLRNGCPNGTATRYEECSWRACPDYSTCSLMQAASRTEETPVLVLLHARYQRHMEDMSPFITWYDGEQEYRRTLLLVDELPVMFDDTSLCIATLNEAETEFDMLKASYRYVEKVAKQNILYHWSYK